MRGAKCDFAPYPQGECWLPVRHFQPHRILVPNVKGEMTTESFPQVAEPVTPAPHPTTTGEHT